MRAGTILRRMAAGTGSWLRSARVARARACLLGSLLTALVLAGCQSMSDVKPGDGRTATITGHTYDDIWRAALKVADEHFEIREQDQTRGVIRAERTQTFAGYGAWVGISIVPAGAGADSYTVEVVSRKKLMTNVTEQGWEKKILRDLEDVLASRPMR